MQRIRQCDVNELAVFRNCFEGFRKFHSSHLELRLCLYIFVFPVLRSAFVPTCHFMYAISSQYKIISTCYTLSWALLLPNPSNRPKESHGHSLPLNSTCGCACDLVHSPSQLKLQHCKLTLEPPPLPRSLYQVPSKVRSTHSPSVLSLSSLH